MQSFIDWLIGEAGAAWIIGISGLIFGIYSWYKNKYKQDKGRHVICIQRHPSFTHLRLSEEARESVNVEYRGTSQEKPIPIETLGQTIIDIKLESSTEALNMVELKFRLPDARVLRVWWEDAPEYLIDESEIDFYPVESSLNRIKEADEMFWEIRVFIPQLKVYEKYHEKVGIGILADGNLDSITMPPQGSTGGEFPDQVWIAKYIPYEVYREMLHRMEEIKSFLINSIILVTTGVVLLILIDLGVLESPGIGDFPYGYIYGFISAGIIGFILGQIREARNKVRLINRPLDTFPDA
jgi:hypothetical protein